VRQKLRIVPDPRVTIAPAALIDEFDLALKVQDGAKRSAAAVKDATALLKTLAQREGGDTKLRPQIRELMTRVSVLAGIPAPWDSRAERPDPPAPPGSLKNIAEEFANLQDAVDGADAEPSPDARAAYATLSTALAAKLQLWQQLRQTDLAEVK
jgi:hypothetical protein